MSLVLTLASRNLFQDRLRFVASLTGIVLSVVLVMVQLGIYFGFSRMLTTVIDHTSTDLWVVSSGAKYFEDLSLLNSGIRDSLMAVDGVAEATPVVAGFSAWGRPDGAITPVFVIGCDFSGAGMAPWNVVEGAVESLTTPGVVAVDRSYFGRLNVSGVGATSQLRALPVKVGAVTDGIRSFTTTPYVFSDIGATRSYVGLPEDFTTHYLLRVQRQSEVGQVRQRVLSKVPGIQVLAPDEFRNQSRSFWLFETGAGAALFGGALLGAIVGTVIVAQILYSSTKDHLYEFATLRAMGASNGYIYKVIISQALINAFIGFVIAALVGAAIVRLTARSAIQVVIPPNLLVELLLLTFTMSVVSAITAILRVIRVDPAIVLTR
jgi:putative ABC transport system permease protein